MNLFVPMVVTQDVSVFFHLMIRGINNSDAIDWALNLSGFFRYLAKGSFHLFIYWIKKNDYRKNKHNIYWSVVKDLFFSIMQPV